MLGPPEQNSQRNRTQYRPHHGGYSTAPQPHQSFVACDDFVLQPHQTSAACGDSVLQPHQTFAARDDFILQPHQTFAARGDSVLQPHQTSAARDDFVLQPHQTFAACGDFVGQAGSLRPSGTRPAGLSSETAHLWLRLRRTVGQTIALGGLPTGANWRFTSSED
jgi:hypothetical protein